MLRENALLPEERPWCKVDVRATSCIERTSKRSPTPPPASLGAGSLLEVMGTIIPMRSVVRMPCSRHTAERRYAARSPSPAYTDRTTPAASAVVVGGAIRIRLFAPVCLLIAVQVNVAGGADMMMFYVGLLLCTFWLINRVSGGLDSRFPLLPGKCLWLEKACTSTPSMPRPRMA